MPRFRELRGVRFAPTPSGDFHLGNLRTAWISHRLATELIEPWDVRVEDIDTERCREDFVQSQLSDLKLLGLSTAHLYRQSGRLARHRAVFESGVAAGWIYPCACSRREVQEELAQHARAPHGAAQVYTGECRLTSCTHDGARGWRLRSERSAEGFLDALVGRTQVGMDDFQPSYPFACAVDDWDARYAWIMRGADLAEALPLQREIQGRVAELEGLGAGDWNFARVLHTRLVTRNDGGRLEKRTQGVKLAEWLATGRTVAQLLAGFERSVEPGLWGRARRADPATILFEEPRTLSVAEWGAG